MLSTISMWKAKPLNQELTPAEAGVGTLAFAEGGYVELLRHGVHCLGAHAVHTYAFLEMGVVELAAGVQLGGGVHHLVQGNAAAIVPDGDRAVLDGDVNPFAESHGEFVHRVVDDFLQEHVDAVLGLRAVAQASDVHAGPRADVLHVGEVPDIVFAVLCGVGHCRWF